MKWKQHLQGRVITVEEFAIEMKTTADPILMQMRYVKHNGYTTLKCKAGPAGFIDWVDLHLIDMTRYDKPHWYKPVRFFRKRRLTLWAVRTTQAAYNRWYIETVRDVYGPQ